MTNKKELINTILDFVNDSIDLDSNKVNLGVLITLLNDNIPEQLTIGGVSQQRELLKGFMQYVNCTDTTNHIYGHLLEDYLKTI